MNMMEELCQKKEIQLLWQIVNDTSLKKELWELIKIVNPEFYDLGRYACRTLVAKEINARFNDGV